MTALGHFYRRLSFATTGVQHAQRLVAKSGQKRVQILPEDRLTELPLCGAINVARKLFSDVIKIAIPHRESSTSQLQNRYFVIPTRENEPLWCNITGNHFGYMVKKGTKKDAFHAKKYIGGMMLPSAAAHHHRAGAGAGVVQPLSEKWQNAHHVRLACLTAAEPATGRGWPVTPH